MDWVVLTAALVGLGLAVMGVVSKGVQSQAQAVETQITSQGIPTTFAEFALMRPFSYTPHDQALFDMFHSDLSTLSDEELDQMNAYQNWLFSDALRDAEERGLVLDESDLQPSEDLFGSLDTIYHERGRVRDAEDQSYDAAVVSGASDALGGGHYVDPSLFGQTLTLN
ncbi:hypothetical protein [Jannaschia ovalis]|uniref:Uncharacterized protein n=1 Tax=Jannaschia ovalis TaxID=3038773 RepID=A0ABY8LI19_9RHOB|nr:hypothetical protein [Jannaschia sp. GRR-S6-38]WGH79753.1 hypothetical protein P8627_05690 [Jannaschia sp. GRR-S6-38]